MKEMYRQGDLLFIKVDHAPKGTQKHNRIVLDSMITGHNHEITKGEVYTHEPERWADRSNFYVVIPQGGAELIHPEHRSIPLSEGVYSVIRQREVNGYVKD